MAERPEERIGQQLGNYWLVALLGQGGFAEVYLGQHVRFNMQAAIKVLHSSLSDQEAQHFQQEAETIAGLAHPSIVRVLDFDVQDGLCFLVMDYAPHGSLRQRHPAGAVVPLSLIVSYVQQVADALQYAHEHKVVHRDVKPENLLLGRRQEVLVSDFGIATVAHSTASLSAEAAVGTLAYMAPEQIEGHPRAASDQYALGVVVYEWLCGRRPFEGSPTEVMVQHLSMPPPPLHEQVVTIPLEVEQVVLRALAKEPKQRFASVQAFAAALQQASQGTPSLAGQFVANPPLLAVSAPPSSATEAMPPTGQEDAGATQPEGERPWNVPFGRNPFFTGRGPLLERLYEQLSRSHSAALNQSYALSGLGGIGKTQTAIEYAYRYREEYSAVFWVRAASRETLVADFVALARLLALPGQDAQDQLLIVAAVKHWLEQHAGWLLILDNTDELPLLADFLPSGGTGHVLLTTRAQATGKIAQSLSVEKMELSEGMQLLLRRAKLLDPEELLDNVSAAVRKAAQQLVEELDGLPLALDQAGAYIEETGCSLSEYLELYVQHRLALLQQQSSMSTDYPHSVASTWTLSFGQVERTNPAAADLLRFCAFLSPEAIPEEIITQSASVLGPMLQPVASNPMALNEAIKDLRNYSLVHRDPGTHMLTVHRLVQTVIKDGLDPEKQQQWAQRAVEAVSEVFPEVQPETWPRCERLLPHALACIAFITQENKTFPKTATLLQRVGWYLGVRARYAEAEPLLQRALIMRKQQENCEPLDIVQCLRSLGEIYYYLGRYPQSEQYYQEALTLCKQKLGAEHRATAQGLNDLGGLYYIQGEYDRAEPLLTQALALREHILGPEHLEVSETLNNLAILYRIQGKYNQAEALLRRAVEIRERTLGPDHPEVTIFLNNLALLYSDLGKYDQAELLSKRTLDTYERTLGPDHPEVAQALIGLAQLYIDQRKYDQAEPLLRRALTIHEQKLGAEHPEVAESLNNLAVLYNEQGKYDQAEPLLRRALALRTQAFDPEHPGIAQCLSNLAVVYHGKKEYLQAEDLFKQALTMRERTLGPDALLLAYSLRGLANLYTDQGRYVDAEPLYQRALKIQEHLSPNHLEVATTLESYAYLLRKVGRELEAGSLEERAMLRRFKRSG